MCKTHVNFNKGKKLSWNMGKPIMGCDQKTQYYDVCWPQMNLQIWCNPPEILLGFRRG